METLAKDLTKEFPSTNSFSPDNLWRMRQLYAAYSDPGFLGQLVPETPSERGSAEILGHPGGAFERWHHVMFDHQPVLRSDLVELRPLRSAEYDDLYAVAADPLIWDQLPVGGSFSCYWRITHLDKW